MRTFDLPSYYVGMLIGTSLALPTYAYINDHNVLEALGVAVLWSILSMLWGLLFHALKQLMWGA